jgi:hypothetical protein
MPKAYDIAVGMAKKKKGYKFDKSVDSGPLNPTDSPEMQKTIQQERIRRQIQSRLKLDRK